MNFSPTSVRKSHFSLTEEYNCSRKREKSMNQINVVTIGKLIEAHRDGDEQKFKAYVDFIAKAYEEQGNDRAANIIRSNYTGDYGEQGKVVLDEANGL